MAKKLKKAAKPRAEKTPTGESIWVQLGTPSELTDKVMCLSEADARRRICAHLHSLDSFVAAHQTVDERTMTMKHIADACTEVNSWYVGFEPKAIELLVDELYNVRLAAKAWKGLK